MHSSSIHDWTNVSLLVLGTGDFVSSSQTWGSDLDQIWGRERAMIGTPKARVRFQI